MYDEKFDNLQKRIDEFYENIRILSEEQENLEEKLDEENKEIARKGMMAAEDYVEAYKALLPLGVSEAQDRALIRSIVEKIEIYPERQEDGRIVKSIWFKVPFDISEDERKELNENGWDYEKHVEACCLLVKASVSEA